MAICFPQAGEIYKIVPLIHLPTSIPKTQIHTQPELRLDTVVAAPRTSYALTHAMPMPSPGYPSDSSLTVISDLQTLTDIAWAEEIL